jgi:hypothetical protein
MSDISKVVDFILENHQDAAQRGRFPMWTIYDGPAGYPGSIVARLFKLAAAARCHSRPR